MSKKQAADSASDAKKKKASGGTKKVAAKKPAAKKPAAKKASPARAAKKPKKVEQVEQVELDLDARAATSPSVVDLDDELEDVIDADIIAETPAPIADEVDFVSGQVPDDEDDEDDDDDDDAPAVVEAPLTEEEQQLRELYGAELTAPATAHTEYKDKQTADEDRPMTPEINARDERKNRWEDRRDRRRSRREQRDHERQQRRPGGQGGAPAGAGPAPSNGGGRPMVDTHERPTQPAFPRPPVATAPAPQPELNGHAHDARVGTPLGDAAASVFAQLRNGQPLPVRQLAAMMRKRNLVEVDPDQLAPQLKAELLGDERSYRAMGLRPRIVYRGRDLFAPGPVAMSQTADAESGVAAALSRLAGSTHRALATRIAKASPGGFERLIHAYLVAVGYRDVAWVKRIGGISYATATAPGIDRMVLVSARSGDQPIDRRGVGELRVGVEAKNLVAGVLFSALGLSEDAERELERPGRSIAVVCGDHLVSMLVAHGVGVVSAAAPVHYVDDQLLDELLAG